MAYYRPSMIGTDQQNVANSIDLKAASQDRDEKDKSKDEHVKPLVLFSVDMTHWHPTLQLIILAGGLIMFMCLYGYYQELVVYGWFDRKLSMFATFLHFLGCFGFAQIQRNLSRYQGINKPHTTAGCAQTTSGWFVFTLGTAPPRVALMYYFLLIVVRTGAQGMSNLSMTQINYPAKVLFKSATPIVTMIIGLSWFRKSYPTRDYIVVLLLIVGLYIFITDDHANSPSSTKLGLIYVTISLFGSAAIPMIQEHCMNTYNCAIEDMLYHTFLGSALASFLASALTGELVQGIGFLINTGSVHAWFIMFAFTIFGFCGTNFSAGLTQQYGSLVNGIINTLRKGVTLGLSFILFPERNIVTSQKLIGSAVFFSGLVVRIFAKSGPERSSGKTKSFEEDVELGGGRKAPSILVYGPASSPTKFSASMDPEERMGAAAMSSPSKPHHLSAYKSQYIENNNSQSDFGQLLRTTGAGVESEVSSANNSEIDNSHHSGSEVGMDYDANRGTSTSVNVSFGNALTGSNQNRPAGFSFPQGAAPQRLQVNNPGIVPSNNFYSPSNRVDADSPNSNQNSVASRSQHTYNGQQSSSGIAYSGPPPMRNGSASNYNSNGIAFAGQQSRPFSAQQQQGYNSEDDLLPRPPLAGGSKQGHKNNMTEQLAV